MTWTVSFNEQACREIREAAHYSAWKLDPFESPSWTRSMRRSSSCASSPNRRRSSAATSAGSSSAGSPYSFLYTLRPGEIRILAVMHQKRRPFYWWGRS